MPERIVAKRRVDMTPEEHAAALALRQQQTAGVTTRRHPARFQTGDIMGDSVRWSIRRHQEGRGGDTVWTAEMLLPGGWRDILPGAPRGQSFLRAASAPAGSPMVARSPGEALAQASSIASQIANNPLLQAALPPGAGVAVAAIDYLAKNEMVGNLANAAKDIVGEGAARIASALKFW